jgi:hypothetical protein
MVERDVVVGKAATIERCLARVEEVRSRARGVLLPVDIEDIVVLNVTRAVQAAADLAARVVAAEGYEPFADVPFRASVVTSQS